MRASALLMSLAVLALGCADDPNVPGSEGGLDAHVPHDGGADASGSDASSGDASSGDASPGDASSGDASSGDASSGEPDAEVGNPDSGAPDGGDAPTCSGYATRYWDCCKAHCGWSANVPAGVAPVTSCDASDAPLSDLSRASACGSPSSSTAFTCTSMAPWSVSSTLAYGFAAVPASGDVCGRCYELSFEGTGHYSASDPGSVALAGKRMIVQATNIGYDVGGGQFDLLIPGGGVGAFDACTYQWGTSDLGAQYGGFLSACRESLGGSASHAALKSCVQTRCVTTFAGSFPDLLAGCTWFVDWFEAADNPNLQYREVSCPDALVNNSGVDRRPLADVASCEGASGERCSAAEMSACDCAWAGGGSTCGSDDGSCCWWACCGA